MANLKCDAKNCIHNDDCYCCISHICVGGARAQSEEETCCDYFKEKSDTAVNQGCGCVDKEKNPVVDIDCKAEQCVYNEDCHCHADEVCICGSSACDCEETCCGTFKAR